VTISLGVATAVRPASPKPDEVVRRADSALYVAKSTGRNRVASAAPEEETAA
jgi:PleD family two-component response regulator